MQPLSLLLSFLLVVAPADGRPEPPPSDEETALRHVAEMKPAEQQEWLRGLEARLDRTADVQLSPEDAAKKREQYAAMLHRKTVAWRDLLVLLREVNQREKAAISRLTRDFRMRATEAFAKDRQEYDRRRTAYDRVMKAWEEAGSPFAEQSKMLAWLDQANQSVTLGKVTPMPPDPKFVADPNAKRVAKTASRATKNEPGSPTSPDKTPPKDDRKSPAKDENKTPSKDEGAGKDGGKSAPKDEQGASPEKKGETPKGESETKSPKGEQSAPAKQEKEKSPQEKPKEGGDSQSAGQHAAAAPSYAPLAAGPFTWVGSPDSPSTSAAVAQRGSPPLAISGAPSTEAAGRVGGRSNPPPPSLGTPRRLTDLHNASAGPTAAPRLAYSARRLASPPVTTREAAGATSPVQVKTADLSAQIDGANFSLRKLEGRLDEDRPWTGEELAPLVKRLQTLVQQQEGFAAIRALVPEDERAAISEPESPQPVIAQLGRRIFEARTAAQRALLSPDERQQEMARLDALSRDLAALGAKK